MKRTLICFFSILLIHAVAAQTEEPQTSNSPGTVEVTSSSNSLSISKEDYQALLEKVEKRATTVESKYFIQKEVVNEYSGANTFTRTAVKTKIYKAGQILIKDQQAKLDTYDKSDFRSRYIALKEIDRIYNRLTYYSREANTRPVEKQLKKLKTSEEIAPVFFGE